MTLAALWGDELPAADYTPSWTEDASPLVAVCDGIEWAYPTEEGVPVPSIDYTVTQVRLPALYDRCRAQWLAEQTGNGSRPDDVQRICTPCDAAPWGADEAWQLGWQDIGPVDRYLLCYDRNIVEIMFSWPPTDDQKAMVGATLGAL